MRKKKEYVGITMPKRKWKETLNPTPCSKTQKYTWNKLTDDVRCYIIRFLTHYRIWHGYNDGPLFSTLAQVSKSFYQWMKKWSWNFSFRTDSFVQFVRLKNMHANALSTWWTHGNRDIMHLRNRKIYQPVSPMVSIPHKDKMKLSPRVEQLQLFGFQNCDLQLFTQLKALQLHFHFENNNETLMLPSNLTTLRLLDVGDIKNKMECPANLVKLGISFCNDASNIILNPSLFHLDVCFSDLPSLVHLTALTSLKIACQIDELPNVSHLKESLETLDLNDWTKPMPTFIHHLHLFHIPNDFMTQVLTLTSLKTLSLARFTEKKANQLLNQMPSLLRIIGTEKTGNKYRRFIVQKNI